MFSQCIAPLSIGCLSCQGQLTWTEVGEGPQHYKGMRLLYNYWIILFFVTVCCTTHLPVHQSLTFTEIQLDAGPNVLYMLCTFIVFYDVTVFVCSKMDTQTFHTETLDVTQSYKCSELACSCTPLTPPDALLQWKRELFVNKDNISILVTASIVSLLLMLLI